MLVIYHLTFDYNVKIDKEKTSKFQYNQKMYPTDKIMWEMQSLLRKIALVVEIETWFVEDGWIVGGKTFND